MVPAYGDSPYLELCVHSILTQRVPAAEIKITTATPSDYIRNVAVRCGVTLIENVARPGIGSDWNFALGSVDSELVTIAHQDDLYDAGYTQAMAAVFSKHPDVSFAFCNYSEHDESGPRPVNANIFVKRALCNWAADGDGVIATVRQKRRLMAWGNPVCCPGVVINRRVTGSFRFATDLRSNLDWDAWGRLLVGNAFAAYVREPLVVHRVHGASETTAAIADNCRYREDMLMFRRFWPALIAQVIAQIYRFSYRANGTG